MSRQGVHGWLKDPVRQEAGRKAAATRQAKERLRASAIRTLDKAGIAVTEDAIAAVLAAWDDQKEVS